jgi:hypothetical protein
MRTEKELLKWLRSLELPRDSRVSSQWLMDVKEIIEIADTIERLIADRDSFQRVGMETLRMAWIAEGRVGELERELAGYKSAKGSASER